jgi:heme exporter protein B
LSVLAIVWKDLLLEARGRETITSLFVLGVLVLVIFEIAIDVVPANATRVAPGILWVAIILSATVALSRVFIMERENGCMTALLLAPVDRGSVFLAKLIVNVVYLGIFEAALLPVFSLLFGVNIMPRLGPLSVVLALGSIGLAATGTLFATVALGTKARELMLPLLVLPLQVPLLIAAVHATEMVLQGHPLDSLGAWGQVLIAFDVLFVTSGWLAFEFISVD